MSRDIDGTRSRSYVTHQIGVRALLLRDCQTPEMDQHADRALRFSRGGGRREGEEKERERRANRLNSRASVGDRPAKNPRATFATPGTKGTPKIRTWAPAGVSRRTSTLALRVFGGFDLVRIRAAHYAHIIGPTNRHRSPHHWPRLGRDSPPAGFCDA